MTTPTPGPPPTPDPAPATPGPAPTPASGPTTSRSRSRSRSRRLAEAALPALAVATAVAAPLTAWNRLPEPVASHWGTTGPDGSLPRVADLVVLALATAVVALGPLLAARIAMPRVQARVLVAAAGFGSVLLAGVRVASVRANLDAVTWELADPLGGGTMAVVVLVAVVAAAVGWVAAGDRPDLPPPAAGEPTRVEVARGEAVVWTSGASGRSLVLLAAGLLVLAALGVVVLPPDARVTTVIVLPLVALAVAAFGQVRVTVGPRGLTVACGWLGFPRLRVPVEDVANVSVEDVSPMSYGGWGLRMIPGATAVIVRRGPGIRVERRDGKVFVVTVDDAARGAGVLLAHRDLAATTSPSA